MSVIARLLGCCVASHHCCLPLCCMSFLLQCCLTLLLFCLFVHAFFVWFVLAVLHLLTLYLSRNIVGLLWELNLGVPG